ncbi:MAG TPA: 4-alpha-glucanotransferase, partial [Planctomycetota bacterium]|nr:4-alpha-glucanotransferase [Planctomycetota bacterium]
MPVNFVLCLHNHQPVDNFDPVFVQAYNDSYLPFLERIETRPGIKFAAHYSGPLLEWLDKNRPEFLARLKSL